MVLERLELAHGVGHEGRLHLDLDLDLVESTLAEQDDPIPRLDALDVLQHRLDGGRVDVHTSDDQHVVGTRIHLAVPGEDPSARARSPADAGQVTGAVADNG